MKYLPLWSPQGDYTISWCILLWCRCSITAKQPNSEMWPIAYISRTLTPTEQRYAKIDKEALHFLIETDHKPLLLTKHPDKMPIRVKCFHLWHIATPLQTCQARIFAHCQEQKSRWTRHCPRTADAFVSSNINTSWKDPDRTKPRWNSPKVKQHCQEGWPDNSMLKGQLRPIPRSNTN